jgi:hypothetical protein
VNCHNCRSVCQLLITSRRIRERELAFRLRSPITSPQGTGEEAIQGLIEFEKMLHRVWWLIIETTAFRMIRLGTDAVSMRFSILKLEVALALRGNVNSKKHKSLHDGNPHLVIDELDRKINLAYSQFVDGNGFRVWSKLAGIETHGHRSFLVDPHKLKGACSAS